MIRSASDYQFVDASGLVANGRIIPQLDVDGETPYVLRAEDMAFLAEMAFERGFGAAPPFRYVGPPVSLLGRVGSSYGWYLHEPVFDTIAYHLTREYDFSVHRGGSPFCAGLLKRGPYVSSSSSLSYNGLDGHYVNPSWTPPAKIVSNSAFESIASLLINDRAARLPDFSVERGSPVLSPADMRRAVFGLEGLKCALAYGVIGAMRACVALKMSGDYSYSYTDYSDASGSYTYTAQWTDAWRDTAVDNGRGGTFDSPFAAFSASRSRTDYTTESANVTSLVAYTKETALKSLKLGCQFTVSGSTGSVSRTKYVTLFLDCTQVRNDEPAWTQKWVVDFAPITVASLKNLMEECGIVIPSSAQSSSVRGSCAATLSFAWAPSLLYIEPDFRAEVGSIGWDWQPGGN